MGKSVCIQGVNFKRINENSFKQMDVSDILFFMISQSGAVDGRGIVYFCTPTAAFYMNKNDYRIDFIDNLLLYLKDWNLINIYFCDFLIINPKIYDFLVHELCLRNSLYFWFDTAIDVYRDKYCK